MRKKTIQIAALACIGIAVAACKQSAPQSADETTQGATDTTSVTEVQVGTSEEVAVEAPAKEEKDEVEETSLRDLLDKGNDNIADPVWKKRLTKLVGKANYDFMLEQYMGTGIETEEGMMGRYMTYTFGGSTKENWDDGYTVSYACGDGHESLEVTITRNGKSKTYEETK